MKVGILDISEQMSLYILCGSIGWFINKADGVASALIGASVSQNLMWLWGMWLEHKAQKRRLQEYEQIMKNLDDQMIKNVADLSDIKLRGLTHD